RSPARDLIAAAQILLAVGIGGEIVQPHTAVRPGLAMDQRELVVAREDDALPGAAERLEERRLAHAVGRQPEPFAFALIVLHRQAGRRADQVQHLGERKLVVGHAALPASACSPIKPLPLGKDNSGGPARDATLPDRLLWL